MEANNPSQQSVKFIKDYINIKIDIVLLSIGKKLSDAAAYAVFAVILGFIAMFITLFLSLSLATWLAEILNHPGLGNLIVSLIYFILALILYIFREKLILGPIKRSMTKSMDLSDLNKNTSIKGNVNLEESIDLLKTKLEETEGNIDQNMVEIKNYYSFDELKNRFVSSIINNPKSILNTLLILRELIRSRKKKK